MKCLQIMERKLEWYKITLKMSCIYIILSSWPAVVTAVALTATYSQSHAGFTGREVSVLAGSAVACGGQCLLHPQCGAYVFRSAQQNACILVVENVKKGTNQEPGRYFSRASLSNGDILHRVPTSHLSVNQHLSKCPSFGSRLVHFPSSHKDLVALQSYPTVIYDLTRKSETDVFTTHDGAPVDASVVHVTGETSPQLKPQCFVGSYSLLFRMNCTIPFITDFIICQHSLD